MNRIRDYGCVFSFNQVFFVLWSKCVLSLAHGFTKAGASGICEPGAQHGFASDPLSRPMHGGLLPRRLTGPGVNREVRYAET